MPFLELIIEDLLDTVVISLGYSRPPEPESSLFPELGGD
jgi:hypothetical protein